jgi:hypothetical protein
LSLLLLVRAAAALLVLAPAPLDYLLPCFSLPLLLLLLPFLY